MICYLIERLSRNVANKTIIQTEINKLKGKINDIEKKYDQFKKICKKIIQISHIQ